MKKVLAIADDLSGAAEIAGIGLRYGLATRLVRDRISECGDGLTVIDTDSRLLSPQAAAQVVQSVVGAVPADQFDLIYKKTDSAFRGPILAEVCALLPMLGKSAALLVPQNPSRGRTIRYREYRIDGVPLHQTSFANDPDHPAGTSDVLKLLGDAGRLVTCVDAPSDLETNAVCIGGADDLNAVRLWADRVTRHVLPVGGADFFAANLESRGRKPSQSFLQHLSAATRLFICGSASAYSRELIALARNNAMVICELPDDVYDGGDVNPWADIIASEIQQRARVLVTITQPLDRHPGASGRLQSILADAVSRVLSQRCVDALFLEGGATASAVCRRLNWRDLEVTGELDTGVVQMRASPQGQMLILKPGSYPWPQAVLQKQ